MHRAAPPRPRPARGSSPSPRRSPRSSRRRAAEHDREASATRYASVDALKRAGYFTAPIPPSSAGSASTSVHDVVVASSRLARGDASVAIGVNMHMVVAAATSCAAGRPRSPPATSRRAAAFGASLSEVARDGVVIAAAISEPARTSPARATTATRTAGGLADRRPQGVLHDVAGGDRPLHRRHVRRRRRRRALRLRARSRPTRPASRSTTTGTRSACAPRAATP